MGSLTFECFDQEQTVLSIAAATGVAERQVRTIDQMTDDDGSHLMLD